MAGGDGAVAGRGGGLPTSEAVTSVKSATGFPRARAVTPAAVAIATRMLMMTREAVTPPLRISPIAGCPVWPARKRGKGSAGSKLSFVGIGYASSTGTADRYPAIAVQKRRNLGLTWAAWEL